MSVPAHRKLISYKGEPWVLCRARKQHLCHLSRRIIYPGDMVYRPMTNGNNRMNRIRASAMPAPTT